MKSMPGLTDRPGYRVIRSLARKLRQIRSRVEGEVPASLISSRGESMQIAGDGHWKRSIASKRLQFTQSLVLMLLPALLTGCGGGSMGPGSPAVTLSTNSLSFPDEAPGGASPAQAVAVTNSGTAALNITSITVAVNFQEIDDCGSQLAAGSHCTINVTFVPTTTGNLQGAITVADNASGSPQSITLAGQGVSSGPPPAATLTGYCFGTITGTNMCALVKDVISCPVGQVASQPGFSGGCLPPSSQYVDSSTSCQGKTIRFPSLGLTVKGSCVVAQ